MSKPITLPDDMAEAAAARVAACRFSSIEDAVRAGIEALQARDEAAEEWLGYARDAYKRGVEASEQGRVSEMDGPAFTAWLDKCLDEPAP